jgi:hypothetical protein
MILDGYLSFLRLPRRKFIGQQPNVRQENGDHGESWTKPGAPSLIV